MDLRIDRAALRDAITLLESYQGPQMEKRLQRATLAGANALRGPIKAATPRARGPEPKPERDLAASVRVRRIRDKVRFIGYRVGPGGKLGFHRFWVIGGTKPHRIYGKAGTPLGLPFGPRAFVKHLGARANPYVERVGKANEGIALAAFLRYLRKP